MSEVDLQFVVRKAGSSDLDAVLRLYASIGAPTDRSLDRDEALALFDRIAADPDQHIYVALVDTRLVGTFMLAILPNLAHGGAPVAIVESVVVDPEWRGRGLGRRMMLWAIETSRRAGCYKLALSSNVARTDAHRFYERLGFERHGYSFRLLL